MLPIADKNRVATTSSVLLLLLLLLLVLVLMMLIFSQRRLRNCTQSCTAYCRLGGFGGSMSSTSSDAEFWTHVLVWRDSFVGWSLRKCFLLSCGMTVSLERRENLVMSAGGCEKTREQMATVASTAAAATSTKKQHATD